MTDNLERLRARDEFLSQWAVAEIERLRAELKTWHDFGRGLAQSGMNGLTLPFVEEKE